MLPMRQILLALAVIYLNTLTLVSRTALIALLISFMILFNKNVLDVLQINQYLQVNYVNLAL